MLKINNLNELKKEHIGKYLQCGGQGLIDGIKSKPTKYSIYKIEDVLEDRIRLRKYRARSLGYIPKHNYNQEAIIWDYKDYKNFPIYG